jgi:UDP-GlcNAc3NAcA epimerase
VKIVTVLGARPQFIKASAVSRALAAANIDERIVHTGQHFSDDMSAVFFRELGLPDPHCDLGVHGGGHGAMTGRMLPRVEEVLLAERPDAVLVYGDTNSTLAGALAAAKLQIPVVHVEAGLRSRRRGMPEEINRIVADRVSTLLCCPSRAAVDTLRAEGVGQVVAEGRLVHGDERLEARGPWVANVGDVMYDVLLEARGRARAASGVLGRIGLQERQYVVLTIHRAENTSRIERLEALLAPIVRHAASLQVVFPVHPRTEALLREGGAYDALAATPGMTLLGPLPYFDFLQLQASAAAILTDSGGIQKEAYWLRVPCITLRDETEWPETTVGGWNRVVGSAPGDVAQALASRPDPDADAAAFGVGDAAERIVRLVRGSLRQ